MKAQDMAPVASPPIWASCLYGEIESASESRQSPGIPLSGQEDERGPKKTTQTRLAAPSPLSVSAKRDFDGLGAFGT